MKYRTIVADPPWPHDSGFGISLATGAGKNRNQRTFAGVGQRRTVHLSYPSMSVADISALSVSDIADRSGCRLFLWATNMFLPSAFNILETWGFKYTQTIVWHKLNASPFAPSIARNTAEFLLVGKLGNPARLSALPSAVVAHGVPKSHSRKPDLFIDLIEQVSPSPYVELFARRHRLGWDVWGNESANTATLEVSA